MILFVLFVFPFPKMVYSLTRSCHCNVKVLASHGNRAGLRFWIAQFCQVFPHWGSKLQEKSDIKMFTNDPKFNFRLPSPTSLDGIKPSSGQKNCSHTCRSLTIKSLFPFFKQSLVIRTSSPKRSSLKVSCWTSLTRSSHHVKSKRRG